LRSDLRFTSALKLILLIQSMRQEIAHFVSTILALMLRKPSFTLLRELDRTQASLASTMEGVDHTVTKDTSVKQDEGGSFLPSSLWQWEANDDEVQDEQPFDFSDDVAVNDWNEADLVNQIHETTDSALQNTDSRLVLQGLISAFVVVLCGFVVMLFNIASSVGFIICSGASISKRFEALVVCNRVNLLVIHFHSTGTIVQSVRSSVHFYLLVFRVVGEVLIVVGLVAVFAHRIVGFGLGLYLRTMLDPEHIGQYAFQFDWVSLRCGLDQNMLVVAGFEWRNPPLFTNTPYFLRINEISFVIDSTSVYRALRDDKESIKITQIKLDKATIYLEKLSQRSIDRATARAAHRNPTLATPAQEPAPAPAEDRVLDESAHAEWNNTDLDDATTNTPAKGKKANKQLPVGMLNLWACMGATDFSQEASFLSKITKNISKAMAGTTNMVQLLGSAVARIDVAGAIFKGAQNVGSSIGSTIGSGLMRTFGTKKTSTASTANRDRTRTMSTVDSGADEDMNASTHSNGNSNSAAQAELTMAETMAALQAEYPDLVLPPLPEDALDEDDIRHNSNAASAGASASVSAATSAKVEPKKKVDKWKGFGVPYTLEIDQLYLHDVQVHAQDFLNSKHSKDRKAGVIKLKSVTMFRSELTDAPDRKVSKNRRGIYLDKVVWRLVNKLLAELLRHNSIAMMVLLTSAAANRTTSAVSSGANVATSGATTAKKAFTGLGSVFGGKSPVRERSDTTTTGGAPGAPLTRGRSDTGASVGSVGSTTGKSSAHEVDGSAASTSAAAAAQIQAQAAAQSAFKALNSTGATAVNAFQSIMKRTGSSKQT